MPFDWFREPLVSFLIVEQRPEGFVVVRVTVFIPVLRQAVAELRFHWSDCGASDRRHVDIQGRQVYIFTVPIKRVTDMVNDRPRGILTAADRKLLRMDAVERSENYSRPNRHQRWSTIEERTRNGIEDLSVLYRHLPEKRRKNVFENLTDSLLPWAWINLLAEGFGFQLLGILEQIDSSLDDDEVYQRVFERSIERALTKYSGGDGIAGAKVTVDVTIEGWAPYDEIYEHEDLSGLRPEMLRSLLNAGEITDEQFAEAILAQSDDDTEE
jgi:hypothetical protein